MDEFKDYKGEAAYKAWKRIVQSSIEFPLDDYHNEAIRLHDERYIRKSGGKISSRRLSKISRQEVEIRSRIVAMTITSKKMQYKLVTANKACKDFLNSKTFITGRTQAERTSHISRIVKKGMDRESEFASFIDSASIIIEDIDKTYWNLKLQMDALGMASKPEMSI